MNTTLQNLYINKDYYSKDYNYYNYFKFRQSGIIPIYYKTPSIFLDGLYFKVPDCQIIKIETYAYDADFILTIKISEDAFIEISNNKYYKKAIKNKLIQIFKELDNHNVFFFEKNYKFFPLKRKRTNKSYYNTKNDEYQKETQELKNNIQLDWDGVPIKTIENNIDNTNRFNKPEQYAKYSPFLESDNSSITMKVNIKYNYFNKLLNLINKNGLNNNTKKSLNPVIELCNQDFYLIKKRHLCVNLNSNTNIILNLCLKSNIFYLDGKNITMKWSICDF